MLPTSLVRMISIHAPLAGSDSAPRYRSVTMAGFQSTLPLRGATKGPDIAEIQAEMISIHAPLAGSDNLIAVHVTSPRHFNPRSPCGERPYEDMPSIVMGCHFNPRSPCGERPNWPRGKTRGKLFQSTLPLRGATRSWRGGSWPPRDFNPRSPCGERHVPHVYPLVLQKFQSTLPLRGATIARFNLYTRLKVFQSTLPLRGATRIILRSSGRAGFQSTLPLRGATDSPRHRRRRREQISIHAPLAGSDR